MVDLWILNVISLRGTFDQSLMKIFPGIKEMGADTKFKAQFHDHSTMTLALRGQCLVES